MSILVSGVHTSSVTTSAAAVTVLSAEFVRMKLGSPNTSSFAFAINGGPHGSFTVELALYQTLFGQMFAWAQTGRLIASHKHHQLFACTMPPPCLRLSPRMPRAILRIKLLAVYLFDLDPDLLSPLIAQVLQPTAPTAGFVLSPPVPITMSVQFLLGRHFIQKM
ncbi:hypothetical protein C8R45DRAFT_1113337 [Mycena sanguinolenta]|nr:hypothetical protein C8R45DRAFT_1113337 [Mycena sanguinolenta]